jgi:hypothetical protein
MKISRTLVLSALFLAAAAMTSIADGITLEVGGYAYDFNALSALQTPAPATTVTNNADFSPDPYINGSYTLKIDDATKLKLGLMAEDMMGTISPSFVSIARAEPYVDLSMGALSARVSLPLYFLGYDTTNDAKYAEIKYILDKVYKGISLSTWYNSSNTFLFTNYESVAYKVAFDKTTALTFSASTEIGFVPAVWVYDVKPQVSFVWGPLQLDVKESIYFSDQLASSATAAQAGNLQTTDATFNTRYFTDPKLTFDFGSLGVKGLKAYLAASLYTANASAAGVNWYNNSSLGTATNAAFGSSVTPGVSYAAGPFYVEAAFKYSNYDDKVTDGITKKDPTFDPMLKISYTMSF